MPTASYGIYKTKTASGDLSRIQYKLCACFIILAPIMAVFLLLHDELMKCVTLSGGIKE